MEEQADGIMANELRAAIYSVEAFLPELRGATVRFMEDNQAVMFSVNKWSSRNPLAPICQKPVASNELPFLRSHPDPAQWLGSPKP